MVARGDPPISDSGGSGVSSKSIALGSSRELEHLHLDTGKRKEEDGNTWYVHRNRATISCTERATRPVFAFTFTNMSHEVVDVQLTVAAAC